MRDVNRPRRDTLSFATHDRIGDRVNTLLAVRFFDTPGLVQFSECLRSTTLLGEFDRLEVMPFQSLGRLPFDIVQLRGVDPGLDCQPEEIPGLNTLPLI